MTDPEYNQNAIRELNETMSRKCEQESTHEQQKWKKGKTNIIDKGVGKSALELIRESMRK